MTNKQYLIVGAGLSGSVVAQQLVSRKNCRVVIIDKRQHLGGNCYDHLDSFTNIRINKYGAHLFHTNNDRVWEYINKFGKWLRWEHQVLALIDGMYVPFPVNISTINKLCNQKIKSIDEFNNWIEMNKKHYDVIENSEQMAKSRIGELLYTKLIKDYTYKQWGKWPNELSAEVLARIPVNSSFDNKYFRDKHQALPANGYTAFFEKLLSHPCISLSLNTDFDDFRIKHDLGMFDGIIYTGPIDHYFCDYSLPKLEYRGIDFRTSIMKNKGTLLPNSVVNYPSLKFPYTRIVEYKHFLNQESDHTITIAESSNDGNPEPYYPVPSKVNREVYTKYQELAALEENQRVYFIGRLASYKYFNMDEAILNALNFVDENFVNDED